MAPGSALAALAARHGAGAIQRRVLQRRARAGVAAPSKVEAPTSAGAPLPEAPRKSMEKSFQTDFSDVRVHQGPQAEAVGAQAYTQGSDIHFAPGQYDPASQSGRALLGHELTHVVQQRAGMVSTPQGKDADEAAINSDPALEAEADHLGAAAARGGIVSVSGVAKGAQPKMGSGVIQCGGKGSKSKEPDKSPAKPAAKEEAEEMSEVERTGHIRGAFDKLKPAALAATKKRYDYFKHWKDEEIEKDHRMREELKTIVEGDAGSSEITELVMYGACASKKAAQEAILKEFDRRYPGAAPSSPVAAASAPESADLAKYTYRFYTGNYTGKAALVAAIIDKAWNPSRADYPKDLIENAQRRMASVDPPDEKPDQILAGSSSFKTAALKAYDDALKETSSKTDTQLGLRADHVTYT